MEGGNLAGLVPSCSVKNASPKSPPGMAWRRAQEPESPSAGSDRSGKWGLGGSRNGKPLPGVPASPRPTAAPMGVHGLHSPDMDENSIEGKMARIEKRLKRNLAGSVREELELELEVLQEFQKEMEKKENGEPPSAGSVVSPGAADRPMGNARRKVGAERSPPGGVGGEGEEEMVVKVKRNSAIPVQTHPHTMARMKDWQTELDRRIREQKELDGGPGAGTDASGEQPLFGLDFLQQKPHRRKPARRGEKEENPLAILQEAVDSLVGGFVDVLGLGDKGKEVTVDEPRPLPPQTFSRRL